MNDLELEEHIRLVHKYDGKIDHLTREGMVGNLDDALFLIQMAARDARRRLRKVCRGDL